MKITDRRTTALRDLKDCVPGDVVRPDRWGSWWLVLSSMDLPHSGGGVYLACLEDGETRSFSRDHSVVVVLAELVIG